MGLFDDAVPGGNITKPLMVALGALLVGKMLSGGSAPAEAPAPVPQPSAGPQGGGFMGGLGGLLDKLSNAGHGSTVSSWLGNGQNEPIQPTQLQTALGQTTIADLARQAGISEQELLAQLAQSLPGVVDKLTPNGRVPSQPEIQSVWNRA
nr:YidB family protein [uncultured Rhodopila sp.]